MTIAWKDVIAKPEYQALSPQEKADAQAQYFNEVIAPQAGDDAPQAKAHFYAQYPVGGHAELFEDVKGQHESALKEDAKMLATAPIKALDTIPEMGNSVLSALAWTGGKLGIGDGNYIPAETFSEIEPDWMKPETEWGETAANVGGFLLSAPDAPVVAGKLAKRAATAIGKRVAEAEIDAASQIAGAEDAEAERVRSKISPEAQAYVNSIGSAEASRVAASVKEGLRGNLDKIAMEAKTSEERIKIAEELGLDTDTIPTSFFSDNRQFIELYQALRKMPGSALSQMEISAIEQTSKLADDMITKYGGTVDLSQLDQKVREESDGLIEAMRIQADTAYDSVMSRVPPATEAPISDTLKVIRSESLHVGGRDNLLSPASKDILRDLSPIHLESGEIINPTIGAVDKVRTDIGRAISQSEGPYRNAEAGQLRLLYGALTEDMGRAFGRLGMDGDIQRARELVAKRKELEKQSINLFGRDIANSILPKLKDGVVSATQGNSTKLSKVMNSIPKEQRQEVAVSALHYLFSAGTRGGDRALAIPGFVKGYEGLQRNKLAKDALFKYLPEELKQDLGKFYIFTKGMNEAIQAVPATGIVGTITQEFNAADTIAEKIISGEVGKKGALLDKVLSVTPVVKGAYGATKGAVKAVAREVAGVAPGDRLKAAVNMLSTPEYLALSRQYARRKVASEMAIKQAEEALKRSEGFKKWYDRLTWIEKNFVDRVGPYKAFAYWATLQYGNEDDE